MGTIFAPTYATLSMGCFEVKLYSACTFKYGEILAEYIKENWNRFLDEYCTVLKSSQISPEELLQSPKPLKTKDPILFSTKDL